MHTNTHTQPPVRQLTLVTATGVSKVPFTVPAHPNGRKDSFQLQGWRASKILREEQSHGDE